MSKPICPHCGRPMVEYRFGFNKGLAIFLGKLYDRNAPTKTDDLGLSYSQRTNSQKLRYWGLAVPYLGGEGATKRGWWQITLHGKAFVEGRATIQKYAVVSRNKIIRYEGERITFQEVSDGYRYHQSYADAKRDQLAPDDPTLF